jgi:hypothetical protein
MDSGPAFPRSSIVARNYCPREPKRLEDRKARSAAGVTDKLWSIGDMVKVLEEGAPTTMKMNIAIGLLAAIVLALAFYGLDRGISLGSSTEIKPGGIVKHCRYLFLRGIVELPALGGTFEQIPGFQVAGQPDRLYCRLIAE